MKLCKDCAHYRPAWPQHHSRCAALPSPVTGKPGDFCDIQRQYGFTQCGTEGRLWQPRPRRWWQLWRSA